jgi:hypothetical protein
VGTAGRAISPSVNRAPLGAGLGGGVFPRWLSGIPVKVRGLVWSGLVWLAPGPWPHRLKGVRRPKAWGAKKLYLLSPELPLSPGDYRHMGSAHAAIRSPRVWYVPGIDPPISHLRNTFVGGGGVPLLLSFFTF